MGMVLPTVDLIPTLTTWENVAITLLLDGRRIDEGRTIVMATHDTRAAAYADRSIRLLDGRLVVATPQQNEPTAVARFR